MAVTLYTKSVEAATITLTNCESSSDEDILKWRDKRQSGVNSTTVNSDTRQIRCNFGDNTTIDYIILGNITTSAACDIDVYHNVPGFTLIDSVGSATYTNDDLLFTFTESDAVGDFRIDIDPDSSSSVSVGCVFMGNVYTFPVNYQQDNNRGYFRRHEKDYDVYGYSYSQIWNSNTKQVYDFGFHLSESQLTTLKSEFANFDFGAKRFWIKDTNVDSNIHLVEWLGEPELTGDNIASGYYRVPFVGREV